MKKPRKPFVLAAILHLAFFGVLAAAAFWPEPKLEEPYVFEMVYEATEPQPEAPPAQPELQTPELPQVTERSFEPVPDVPEPAPKPSLEHTPTPQPTPKPEARPERKRSMSLEEFRRMHGAPAVTRPQPQPRPAPPPRIERERTLENLDTENQPSAAAVNEALATYEARLSAQLDLAWRKPDRASVGEFADVEVLVNAQGVIVSTRIVRQSGGAEFVQSVKEALARMRSIGPTPNGQSFLLKRRLRIATR